MQARRMQQWEERGYGQGRKKKKSKDVKKAFEKKLDTARGRREAVRAVGAAARSRAAPRGAATSSFGSSGAVRRARRRSGSGRSTSRSAGASGSRSSAPNGSGKTTLLDALLGRLPLARGHALGRAGRRARRARAAARDVRRTTSRSSTRSCARAGCPSRRRARCSRSSTSARTTCCGRAASLSPGERTRAVLALLSARGVNCLVLDEPTNHLDVEAIEELERALAGYEGTVLLVTHDRLFLERFGARPVRSSL